MALHHVLTLTLPFQLRLLAVPVVRGDQYPPACGQRICPQTFNHMRLATQMVSDSRRAAKHYGRHLVE